MSDGHASRTMIVATFAAEIRPNVRFADAFSVRLFGFTCYSSWSRILSSCFRLAIGESLASASTIQSSSFIPASCYLRD